MTEHKEFRVNDAVLTAYVQHDSKAGDPVVVELRLTNGRRYPLQLIRINEWKELNPIFATSSGEKVRLTTYGREVLADNDGIRTPRAFETLSSGEMREWSIDLNRIYRLPLGDSKLSVSLWFGGGAQEGETIGIEHIPIRIRE